MTKLSGWLRYCFTDYEKSSDPSVIHETTKQHGFTFLLNLQIKMYVFHPRNTPETIYLTGVGKLAGENDDVGVLPVDVCIILLLDSGVV